MLKFHSFTSFLWIFLNKIRVYIFLGMLMVISVPFLLLMKTSYEIAFNRELKKVEESHLVIAENLASSLDRYATDVKTTFDFLAENDGVVFTSNSIDKLLEAYNFRMVATVSSEGSMINTLFEKDFDIPSQEVLTNLRANAVNAESIFSGALSSPHGPVIYIARLTAAGTLIFGVIDTSYLIAQQLDIAFGDRGHAMIVDHEGRVLAHPKKEWTDSSKDVSGLEVVQRMTSGQTGVMKFYAPPLQADVIAGYTYVPSTGWGAMVPQPISELEKAAKLEATSLSQILLLLFILALLASWLISGLIARPIQCLSNVVIKVRRGDLSERVPEFKRFTPNELTSLRSLLNALLDSWTDNRALLESSLERANQANIRQAEAISILSHEMRTPLNGVVGSLSLLKQTELNPVQKKYLGFASTSTNTLLKHVNNVLEVSRLDGSKVKINKEKISVPVMLEEIVQENLAQAKQSSSEISLHFSPNTQLEIETDARLFRSIVANLIGNAVKFTQNGTIDVIVQIDPAGFLEIIVKDDGPGIASNEIEAIFQPFTVTDATYGRGFEGTGLGLCIVAMSVNALNGQINVSSEIGTGSEFYVRIPVVLLKKQTKPAVTKSSVAQTLKTDPKHNVISETKSVLVVDDSEINRLVLCEMLQQLGHDVSSAVDGQDALQIAMKESFDLILLDISMPGMDGTEVAKFLQEHNGPNKHTKIIAQTAHASPEDHDRFLAVGIQGVLKKPLSRENLISVLNCLETKERVDSCGWSNVEIGSGAA